MRRSAFMFAVMIVSALCFIGCKSELESLELPTPPPGPSPEPLSHGELIALLREKHPTVIDVPGDSKVEGSAKKLLGEWEGEDYYAASHYRSHDEKEFKYSAPYGTETGSKAFYYPNVHNYDGDTRWGPYHSFQFLDDGTYNLIWRKDKDEKPSHIASGVWKYEAGLLKTYVFADGIMQRGDVWKVIWLADDTICLQRDIEGIKKSLSKAPVWEKKNLSVTVYRDKNGWLCIKEEYLSYPTPSGPKGVNDGIEITNVINLVRNPFVLKRVDDAYKPTGAMLRGREANVPRRNVEVAVPTDGGDSDSGLIMSNNAIMNGLQGINAGASILTSRPQPGPRPNPSVFTPPPVRPGPVLPRRKVKPYFKQSWGRSPSFGLFDDL